jgi:hypothetical protein
MSWKRGLFVRLKENEGIFERRGREGCAENAKKKIPKKYKMKTKNRKQKYQ